MLNEWSFLLFSYLFQSFIYLFSLEVKSISSWEYTRNCDLCGITFDIFGEINNVLCNGFWIFTWGWVVISTMKNYLFLGKFYGWLDVIFPTLRFGSTKPSNYNVVLLIELSWSFVTKNFFDHGVSDNGSRRIDSSVRLNFPVSNRFFWTFFCVGNISGAFWVSWYIWWCDIMNYFFVDINPIFKWFGLFKLLNRLGDMKLLDLVSSSAITFDLMARLRFLEIWFIDVTKSFLVVK